MHKTTKRFHDVFTRMNPDDRHEAVRDMFDYLTGYCDGLVNPDDGPVEAAPPDLLHARDTLVELMNEAGIVPRTKAIPS